MRWILLCLFWPASLVAQGAVDIDMSPALAEAREKWIARDYDGIYDVIRAEAEAGSPVAQNILGASLTEKDGSRGLSYDAQAGFDWYQKARAQGYARAVFNLSLFWKDDHAGFGIDYDKAWARAEEAAELGYAAAYNLMGDMHVHGHGVEVDNAKALKYYRKSADLGFSGGYREIGYAYFHGRGVDKNIPLMLAHLEQAVILGDTKSLPDLAYAYEGNFGVKQDLLKSYLLYQRALDMRIPRAAYELAWFAEYDGYAGFWHDRVEAYGYCLLAIDWGHKISDGEIAEECAKIAEGLSDAEQTRSRAFGDSFK